MAGMSPIAKATLRSLALWAVAADTRELRTALHDAALPILFIREQSQTGGFESAVGHDFFYLQCPVYYLSLYASSHGPSE